MSHATAAVVPQQDSQSIEESIAQLEKNCLNWIRQDLERFTDPDAVHDLLEKIGDHVRTLENAIFRIEEESFKKQRRRKKANPRTTADAEQAP